MSERDKKRKLKLKIKTWIYHVDDPETFLFESISEFNVEKEGPFETAREEWIAEATEAIIRQVIAGMIARHGDRFNIRAPPGENGPSWEWAYKIEDAEFEFEEIEVPKFVLETIKDLERRRDAAITTEVKERIQNTIDELKKEYGLI